MTLGESEGEDAVWGFSPIVASTSNDFEDVQENTTDTIHTDVSLVNANEGAFSSFEDAQEDALPLPVLNHNDVTDGNYGEAEPVLHADEFILKGDATKALDAVEENATRDENISIIEANDGISLFSSTKEGANRKGNLGSNDRIIEYDRQDEVTEYQDPSNLVMEGNAIGGMSWEDGKTSGFVTPAEYSKSTDSLDDADAFDEATGLDVADVTVKLDSAAIVDFQHVPERLNDNTAAAFSNEALLYFDKDSVQDFSHGIQDTFDPAIAGNKNSDGLCNESSGKIFESNNATFPSTEKEDSLNKIDKTAHLSFDNDELYTNKDLSFGVSMNENVNESGNFASELAANPSADADAPAVMTVKDDKQAGVNEQDKTLGVSGNEAIDENNSASLPSGPLVDRLSGAGPSSSNEIDDDDFGDFNEAPAISFEVGAAAFVSNASQAENFAGFSDNNRTPAEDALGLATGVLDDNGREALVVKDDSDEDVDFGDYGDFSDGTELVPVANTEVVSLSLGSKRVCGDKLKGLVTLGDADVTKGVSNPTPLDSTLGSAADMESDLENFGDFEEPQLAASGTIADPFVAKVDAVFRSIFRRHITHNRDEILREMKRQTPMARVTVKSVMSADALTDVQRTTDWSLSTEKLHRVLSRFENFPFSPPSVIVSNELPHPYDPYIMPVGRKLRRDKNTDVKLNEKSKNARFVPEVLSIKLPGFELPTSRGSVVSRNTPKVQQAPAQFLKSQAHATIVRLPPLQSKSLESVGREVVQPTNDDGLDDLSAAAETSRSNHGELDVNFNDFELNTQVGRDHNGTATLQNGRHQDGLSSAAQKFLDKIPDLSFMLKSSICLPQHTKDKKGTKSVSGLPLN